MCCTARALGQQQQQRPCTHLTYPLLLPARCSFVSCSNVVELHSVVHIPKACVSDASTSRGKRGNMGSCWGILIELLQVGFTDRSCHAQQHMTAHVASTGTMNESRSSHDINLHPALPRAGISTISFHDA